MIKTTVFLEDYGITCDSSAFIGKRNTSEHHLIFHVNPNGEPFEKQLTRLENGIEAYLSNDIFAKSHIVFKRYFLSDIENQHLIVREIEQNRNRLFGLSMIQQPPLDGSKVAVWIYMQEAEDISFCNDALCVRNNGYEHLWNMGMQVTEGSSYDQTNSLLEDYEAFLDANGLNIEKHCIRTWFFVRDVDTQYHGLVVARRENFEREGMTASTHYIASTGIYGIPAYTSSIIMLDAYAIKGLLPSQQNYLYAPKNLNRTSDYGVTFERGTKVEYGDRCHLFISGTASINNKGEVVHVGDIQKQTMRMWENVEALLNEGNADMDDIAQIIVYLRDIADYNLVKTLFEKRFPDTPYVITQAPVCRPQWLIEMECIAITPNSNASLKDY